MFEKSWEIPNARWIKQRWRPWTLFSSKLSCKVKTWLRPGWLVVLACSVIHRSIPSSSKMRDFIFVAWAVSILIAKKPDSLVWKKSGESFGCSMKEGVSDFDPTWHLRVDPTQVFQRQCIWNWERFQGMRCRNHRDDLREDPEVLRANASQPVAYFERKENGKKAK